MKHKRTIITATLFLVIIVIGLWSLSNKKCTTVYTELIKFSNHDSIFTEDYKVKLDSYKDPVNPAVILLYMTDPELSEWRRISSFLSRGARIYFGTQFGRDGYRGVIRYFTSD